MCEEVEEDDRCEWDNGAKFRLNTNTVKYHCDCGTTDFEDREGNVVSYVGKRCKFEYSSMCPVPNGYDNLAALPLPTPNKRYPVERISW